MRSQREGTIAADWIKYWNLHVRPGNPPYPAGITERMGYLRRYTMDAAYVPGQRETESTKVYKRRIYKTLRALAIAISAPLAMRIDRQFPEADWETIWKNLVATPTSDEDKAHWYRVIHDIIVKNERLHRNRIAPTDLCSACTGKTH